VRGPVAQMRQLRSCQCASFKPNHNPRPWFRAFRIVQSYAGITGLPATLKNCLSGKKSSFKTICRFRIDTGYRLPFMRFWSQRGIASIR
jgi:hypothetical protein